MCQFYWSTVDLQGSADFFGEGNGNPLQYSCLENPMDGGAVHGDAESDTTKRLHFHFSLSCIGEGNGNPLQCSCLENPRDGGAWWAAVYGIVQSRTRLKRLSSSSSWFLLCHKMTPFYIHVYTYVLFFIYFSIMVYHKILNIVPRALQEGLVVYYSCILNFPSEKNLL